MRLFQEIALVVLTLLAIWGTFYSIHNIRKSRRTINPNTFNIEEHIYRIEELCKSVYTIGLITIIMFIINMIYEYLL